jgi:hypothetical protein
VASNAADTARVARMKRSSAAASEEPLRAFIIRCASDVLLLAIGLYEYTVKAGSGKARSKNRRKNAKRFRPIDLSRA